MNTNNICFAIATMSFLAAPAVALNTQTFQFPKQTIGTVEFSPSSDRYTEHIKEVEAKGEVSVPPGEAVTVVFHDGCEGWIKQLNKQPTDRICGLNFSRCDANGVTSADLKNYRELKLLQLRDTDVGDEAAEAVNALSKIQHLDVSRSKTTPTGLKKWLQTGTIKFLLANNINCKNQNLEFLSKSPLMEIHLMSTGLNDSQVASLCSSRSLQIVSIDKNVGVTNKSVKSLKAIPRLMELNVSETSCTLEGLKMLAGCKSLKRLFVSYKPTDAQALAALKSSLPNCDIRLSAGRRLQMGNPYELFAPTH